MKIATWEVGGKKTVFVIAELGINHDGDFKTAKDLIDKAKWAGVSAVKFQTYITEKRVKKDSPIYGILKKCELSFKQQEELFKYAKDAGILAFSTPFDAESVDFLESINAPCYKIASFDIVNNNLLIHAAQTSKPLIISRGMATRAELEHALGIAKQFNNEIALLHCISAYPLTSASDLNLSTINALKSAYSCTVGFSDHTIGIEASALSVAAGASIVEKHFTLSRKSEGPDHAMSTEPEEMKKMVEEIARVKDMVGEPVCEPLEVEKPILQYRRPS